MKCAREYGYPTKREQQACDDFKGEERHMTFLLLNIYYLWAKQHGAPPYYQWTRS